MLAKRCKLPIIALFQDPRCLFVISSSPIAVRGLRPSFPRPVKGPRGKLNVASARSRSRRNYHVVMAPRRALLFTWLQVVQRPSTVPQMGRGRSGRVHGAQSCSPGNEMKIWSMQFTLRIIR